MAGVDTHWILHYTFFLCLSLVVAIGVGTKDERLGMNLMIDDSENG